MTTAGMPWPSAKRVDGSEQPEPLIQTRWASQRPTGAHTGAGPISHPPLRLLWPNALRQLEVWRASFPTSTAVQPGES
jgi:hypothetical protein